MIKIIDPSKRTPVEQVKLTKSIFDKDSDSEAVMDRKPKGSYPFTQDIGFMPSHQDPSKLREQIE